MIRRLFAICFVFIVLSACSNATADKQVEATKQHKTFRSKSPADKLVPKHPPIYPSGEQEVEFNLKDSKAIFYGEPRPNSPLVLAVLAGNPSPGADICNLKFIAVTQPIFEQCIEIGMNYNQVANTLGFTGKLISSTENSKIYGWASNKQGMVTVTFKNNKVTAKSATGLK